MNLSVESSVTCWFLSVVCVIFLTSLAAYLFSLNSLPQFLRARTKQCACQYPPATFMWWSSMKENFPPVVFGMNSYCFSNWKLDLVIEVEIVA